MTQLLTKTYKNIYFDLDNTLWDFHKNSEQTISELIERFGLSRDLSLDAFLEIYYPINDVLWTDYRNGLLTKEVLRSKRFADAFAHFGITNQKLIEQFAQAYITESPVKTILIDHTIEVLNYLKTKPYRLFLLTNGFREVQTIKIENCGLSPYFEKMICSEDAGYQKPHQKLFEYAIKTVNARKTESIMIGDDPETDIAGARKFGMDCIYFNPGKHQHKLVPTFEIDSLADLKQIL
jgi:putative hydrolase of the HAD superfamily